ncbi:MAG: DUF3147 family protein [Gallionella sp.]
MLYVIKTLLAAATIVIATEVAKRSSAMAAILLALPLVSIIAFSWMWFEGQSTQKIADVAGKTFWYVLPTLPMFLLLSYLLRNGYNYVLAIAASIVLTVGLFYVMQYMLAKFSA